jgi:hypothetical protein
MPDRDDTSLLIVEMAAAVGCYVTIDHNEVATITDSFTRNEFIMQYSGNDELADVIVNIVLNRMTTQNEPT